MDLDVAGTANSFQTTEIKYGTYLEATGQPKPEYISYDGIKYADLSVKTTEMGVVTAVRLEPEASGASVSVL